MEVIVSFATEYLVGIWPTHFQGNVSEKIFFLIKTGEKCIKKRSPLLENWRKDVHAWYYGSHIVRMRESWENWRVASPEVWTCGVAEPNPGVTYLISCPWRKMTPHCLFYFGQESYLSNWKHSSRYQNFPQAVHLLIWKVFFSPVLFRCNWYITLCKFKVYNVMTSGTNKVS